jgi:hypothetical protein
MTDRIEDEMGELGRAVEAAVRIPPYELVVERVRRRRRRRAGAGGLLLAALVTVGVVVLPAVTREHAAGVQPTSAVRIAPPTGHGRLALSDVSYDRDERGLVLGRRCTDTCHDVALATTDKGVSYGPEVSLQGQHRYVAAGPTLDVAYAPDLALSRDGGATWTELFPPQPVADVSFDGATITVLVTPPGAAAELWTGPKSVTSWSQMHLQSTVPGSDDSARLAIAGPLTLVVSSTGTPRVAIHDAGGGWTQRDLGLCAPGSGPSVAPVSATTWWVACRNEVADGTEVVGLTTDSGESYTSAGRLPDGDLDRSVDAVSAQTAYLYGGSSLLVTFDGGATWSVAFDQPGLGAPHIPPGHDGGDVWVLAPGANTVWRQLGHGRFTGIELT